MWKIILVCGVAICTLLSTVACTSYRSNSFTTAIVIFNATNVATGESERLGSADPHDEIGRYGGTSPKENISGPVQVAAKINGNRYGCTEPYKNIHTDGPWIALVERGDCTFAKKIREAMDANASAVIVYDTTNQVTITMSHDDADDIVSVLIPHDVGEDVARRVEAGKKVTASITHGRQYFDGYTNRTSIIFVSLSFLILMIISLTWLIVYYVQRFRIVQSPDLLQQRRAQARKIVCSLPKKLLKEGDREVVNEEVCPVCLEIYKTEETLRILPCKHVFHRKCVDPWLKCKETCPMCKFDVLKSRGLTPYDPVLFFSSRTRQVEDRPNGVVTSTSAESLVPNSRESTLLVDVPPPNVSEQEESVESQDDDEIRPGSPDENATQDGDPQTSSQI